MDPLALMRQLEAQRAQLEALLHQQHYGGPVDSTSIPVIVAGVSQQQLYCVCRQPDDHLPMVGCNSCDEWFHAGCLVRSQELRLPVGMVAIVSQEDLDMALQASGLPGGNYTCQGCACGAAAAAPAPRPRIKIKSSSNHSAVKEEAHARHVSSAPTSSSSFPSQSRSGSASLKFTTSSLDAGDFDIDAIRAAGDASSPSSNLSSAARIPLKRLLRDRPERFESAGVAKRVSAEIFGCEALSRDGFRSPVLVAASESSIQGAVFPDGEKGFDCQKVLSLVGPSRPLDVVDVASQGESRGPQGRKWTLGQFCEYFSDPSGPLREKFGLLSLLSLEVSDTKVMDILEAPQAVREMDWITNLWPESLLSSDRSHLPPIESGTASFNRAHANMNQESLLHNSVLVSTEAGRGVMHRIATQPKVRYYCLMGVKGCYTDWHIDFGGTSVWYHVVSGAKIFLLLPPTDANLRAYESWCQNPNQKDIWFGGLPELDSKIYIEMLSAGDTFFIPSGWIHAVYTPCDSLVFGGNFLHSLSMGMQARVHSIELRCNIEAKFRFPGFELTQWLSIASYLRRLRENNSRRRRPLSRFEADGLEILLAHISEHRDLFDGACPPKLFSMTVGSDPPLGESPAYAMLRLLREALDQATDIEPRDLARHGPTPDPRFSSGNAGSSSDQRSWEANVDLNRRLGVMFEPSHVELVVEAHADLQTRLEEKRFLAEQKRAELLARKLEEFNNSDDSDDYSGSSGEDYSVMAEPPKLTIKRSAVDAVLGPQPGAPVVKRPRPEGSVNRGGGRGRGSGAAVASGSTHASGSGGIAGAPAFKPKPKGDVRSRLLAKMRKRGGGRR